MSCILTLVTAADEAKVVRKGSAPKRPSTWAVNAWFILPNGEKITHSTRVSNQTVRSVIPFMGALIDSLIADHGNEVSDVGWSASTHGSKK